MKQSIDLPLKRLWIKKKRQDYSSGIVMKGVIKNMTEQYYEPADIKIYVVGNGNIVEEKSLLAVKMEGQREKIIAVGNEAEKIGNNQEDIRILSPIHQGVVEDFIVAEHIFKHIIKKAWGKRLKKPVIGYCTMQGLTEVGQILYKELLYCAGAKEVKFLGQIRGDFLQTIPKNEWNKYDIIVFVTKDYPLAYVRERAGEMIEYAETFGVSKEELLGILIDANGE